MTFIDLLLMHDVWLRRLMYTCRVGIFLTVCFHYCSYNHDVEGLPCIIVLMRHLFPLYANVCFVVDAVATRLSP